jgi:cyclopropane-fatty-acyl-phospholipid synthase
MDNSFLIKNKGLVDSCKSIDAGIDFFRLFLDPTMAWSGAYFRQNGMDLEQAQLAKYERLCRQLRLSRTDHVLEIGCGWGGCAIYMAEQYGCKITAITLSEEQFQQATIRVKGAGVEQLVTILLQDYRDLSGPFDKIICIEMQEATGLPDFDTWFSKCYELLQPEGILALQLITRDDDLDHDTLPSAESLSTSVSRSSEFKLAASKDLRLHYAATLKVWFMQLNSHLPELRALGFDDLFIDKWNAYFCSYELAFRKGGLHLMQLVYAQPDHIIHRDA